MFDIVDDDDDNDYNSVSTSQMSSIPLTAVGNECD